MEHKTLKTTKTTGWLAVIAIGATAGGCTDPATEETRATTASITNGTDDAGHPSVGMVTNLTTGGRCTGTLIGSRTVLTAAHCTGQANDFRLNGRIIRAQPVPHPAYDGRSNDIALLILGEPITDVAPSPVNRSGIGLYTPLEMVGFGDIGGGLGGYGTKRSTTNIVASTTPTAFYFAGPHNICFGDSGGPSFVTDELGERVAGVHWVTTDRACGSGGGDMRVDAYADWIQQTSGGDVQMVGEGWWLGQVPETGGA